MLPAWMTEVSKKLWGAHRKTTRSGKRRVAPQIERLESRELLTATLLGRGPMIRPETFANGTYVRDSSTGAIDLIQNGERSWLSGAAYWSLGCPAYTNINDATFNDIPAGPNYTIPNGTYLRDMSTGAIEIVENGEGEMLSPAAYAALGSPTPHNMPDIDFTTMPSGGAVGYESLTLPSFTAGKNYSTSLVPVVNPTMHAREELIGGPPTYTLVSGAPSWLSLTPAGELSGTTTQAGTYGHGHQLHWDHCRSLHVDRQPGTAC